jgi:hypothetical protein
MNELLHDEDVQRMAGFASSESLMLVLLLHDAHVFRLFVILLSQAARVLSGHTSAAARKRPRTMLQFRQQQLHILYFQLRSPKCLLHPHRLSR